MTCRRCGEATDRLRLPRADDVVPCRGHVDGRADRVGGPRRDRPVQRRDDRDPGRDRPSRRGRVDPARTRRFGDAPHTARALVGGVGPRLLRVSWRCSRPVSTPAVLAAGGRIDQALRRPQPGLRVPAAGGIRGVTMPSTPRRLLAPSTRRPSAGFVGGGRSGATATVWLAGTGGVDDPFDVQYRIGSITKTMTAVADPAAGRRGPAVARRPDGRCGRSRATPTPPSACSSRTRGGCRGNPSGSWWERSPGSRLRRPGECQRRIGRGLRRRGSGSTTPTWATRCSVRSARECAAPRGGRPCGHASSRRWA